MRTITSVNFLAFTLGVAFGQPAAERPAFEVASVKPNQSGARDTSLGPSSGGPTATNATLTFLIRWAHDVRDHQISAGPSWLNTERYDIVAKGRIDHPTPAQNRQMLQSLLADGFQLRLLRETKELPEYALVVGKNGPKLRPADGAGMRIGKGRMSAQGISMQHLAENLGNQLGRTVLDRTALKGDCIHAGLDTRREPGGRFWAFYLHSIARAARPQIGTAEGPG